MPMHPHFAALIAHSLTENVVGRIELAIALAYVESDTKQWHIRGVRTGVDEGEACDAECETVSCLLVLLGLLVQDGGELAVPRQRGMLAEAGLDLRRPEKSGSKTTAAVA